MYNQTNLASEVNKLEFLVHMNFTNKFLKTLENLK